MVTKSLKPSPDDGGKAEAKVGLFVFTDKEDQLSLCGPIGKKGTEYCIKPYCSTKAHKDNRDKFPVPSTGLYVMHSHGKMLVQPYVPMKVVKFFLSSVNRVHHEEMTMSAALGFIHTMNKVYESGLDSDTKKEQVSFYVDSLMVNVEEGRPEGMSVTPVKSKSFSVSPLKKKSGDDLLGLKTEEEELSGMETAVMEEINCLKKETAYQQCVTAGLIGDHFGQPINVRIDGLTNEVEGISTSVVSLNRSHEEHKQKCKVSFEELKKQQGKQESRIGKVESNQQGTQQKYSKVEATFKTLLEAMEKLAKQQAAQAGASSTGGSSHGSVTNTTPTVDMTALEEEVEKLRTAQKEAASREESTKKEVEELKEAQAASDRRSGFISLEAGSIELESRADIRELVDGLPPNLAWLICCDPNSAIQRLIQDTVTDDEVRNQQIHESRTSMTDDETKFRASCSSIIPNCFFGVQDDTKPKIGRAELSAMKTFRMFDAGDGVHGIFNFVMKQLPRVKKDMDTTIGSLLAGHPELALIAKGNVRRSCTFIQDFFRFMRDQYNELLQKCYGEGPYTKAQKAEIWDLMLLMFRVVWDTLWETRQWAKSAHVKPATALEVYLESCLKTHMQMEIFIERGFIEHSGIFPKLTRHLFETTVSKEAFDALQTTLDTLVVEHNELKRKYDRLSTRITALEGRNGGGGGGGGGDDDAGGVKLSRSQRKKQRLALANAAKADEDSE